jgi:hypothetical protein
MAFAMLLTSISMKPSATSSGARSLPVAAAISRASASNLRDDRPVGPPRHDIGEGAAAVDPELPLSHRARSGGEFTTASRRASTFVTSMARLRAGGYAASGQKEEEDREKAPPRANRTGDGVPRAPDAPDAPDSVVDERRRGLDVE